ncbi:MAG: hypothetical protein A2Y76_13955 [Planctomycetes bacterium RBG_13_60_9]|nr:MAG: hypothetical protein A2Y76_13955 [Planctomycetes bacterium RBG_13_60_9]
MRPHETPNASQRSRAKTGSYVRIILVAVILFILTGIILWMLGVGSYLSQRVAYAAKAATFSGTSESLQQTVIVPTLDSPCPPNKNVIWCSSFQLAWNEVRDKVIGAPLQVVGAEEVAGRLNQAQESSRDLESSSIYAAGGCTEDGIIDRIKKDMALKFPSHVLPDFNDAGGGILAYSYLTANVPFKYPFQQVRSKFMFGDPSGKQSNVEAFGVWSMSSRFDKIRKQVEVLYCSQENDRDQRVDECVIDLCRDSKPYQVVAAMVKPKGSLAETLGYIYLRMDDFKKSVTYEEERRLHSVDDLKIPEMFWRIDHRFRELIGKTVKNVGMPITEAMQTIEFRLDRSGAVLESEAKFAVKALPREFVFDRPFLVYMQRRGTERPFFVMWVDNAELLTRK